MDRLTIYIVLDLTDAAPSGPGWYTTAYVDQQKVVDLVPIDSADAYDAARVLHQAMERADDELPQNPLPQLVQSGTSLIRGALEKQLQYAETQAAKVALIRKKLATLPKEKE